MSRFAAQAAPASFREPYDGHSGCAACHDTGFLPFAKEFANEATGEVRRLPWSGACYCPRGVWLTQPREGSTQSGRPVLVTHAPRDVYTAKLATIRGAVKF